MQKQKVNIFISYAHADEVYFQKLRKHLVPLEKEEWYNIVSNDIVPGGEWSEKTRKAIEQADIILLLVSPDFLASDYIRNDEMQKSIERYRRGQAMIIPIFIRPAMLEDLAVNRHSILPKNGIPVSAWSREEDAWKDVTNSLREIVTKLSSGVIALKKMPETTRSVDTFIPRDQLVTFRNEVQHLIENNKVSDAFQKVIELYKTTHDPALEGIVFISSRYDNIKRQFDNGSISTEGYKTSLQYVTSSLLSLLDEYMRNSKNVAA